MKNSEREERKCPVCESNNWGNLFESHSGRIMTGDQRIGKGDLHKIICLNCGVAANNNPFSKDDIDTLYGKDYELNTYGREEHLFFTKEGPIARSQVFADWIAPHINENQNNILEIGCGEGLFLTKISKMLPNVNFKGFDGSHKAVELAISKGLDVQQKLVYDSTSKLPNSDCIISINVIEHIEDLFGVIEAFKMALEKEGQIIFCLPIQDFGGYDLAFAEHVWHFTTDHFKVILEKSGLRITHQDSNHPINHGIGLFVCELDESPTHQITNPNLHLNKNFLIDVWSKWQTTFSKMDEASEALGNDEIAVFGSGEILTLLLTFTNLAKANIKYIVDETPSKIGTTKHGIEIIGLDKEKLQVIEKLIVCINPKYYSLAMEKLAFFKGDVIFT